MQGREELPTYKSQWLIRILKWFSLTVRFHGPGMSLVSFGFVATAYLKSNLSLTWVCAFVIQVQSTAFAFKTARHLELCQKQAGWACFSAYPTPESNKEMGFADQVSWESKGTPRNATPPGNKALLTN